MPRFTAQEIVEHYELVFDPLIRAAHRGCQEHALLTQDDGRPTISSCVDFAALFGVPAAELAAFFGYLGYSEGGPTIWVDALGGRVHPGIAQQLANDGQARAFGFRCALLEAAQPGAQR